MKTHSIQSIAACVLAMATSGVLALPAKPIQLPLQMYEVSDGSVINKPDCGDAQTPIINLVDVRRLANGVGPINSGAETTAWVTDEKNVWKIHLKDAAGKVVVSRVFEARVYCY